MPSASTLLATQSVHIYVVRQTDATTMTVIQTTVDIVMCMTGTASEVRALIDTHCVSSSDGAGSCVSTSKASTGSGS